MKLPLLPSGLSLRITQANGVLGGRVWPAAHALCEHLLDHYGSHSHDRPASLHGLELGSGTGAVGLFAAATLPCASMILTEHLPPKAAVLSSVPYSVDGMLELDHVHDNEQNAYLSEKSRRLLNLLQCNVDQNVHLFQELEINLPTVLELDWTQHGAHVPEMFAYRDQHYGAGQPLELILASDVTYISELHRPLAQTLAALLLPPPQTTATTPTPTSLPKESSDLTTCLVAHQQRLLNFRGHDMQLQAFTNALDEAGLAIAEQTHRTVLDKDDGKVHQVFILEIQARKHRDNEGTTMDKQ